MKTAKMGMGKGLAALLEFGLVAVLCSGTARAQSCDPHLGLHFQEVAKAEGIDFRHQANQTRMRYLMETMGAGVGMIDIDNDGRLDLFFVNGAAFPDPNPDKRAPVKSSPAYWNRLYHQKPDGSFEDVTAKAGLAGEDYGMGVAVGDYDNDGFDDLFVTGFPHNHLYHNNGDGTFTDVSATAGLSGEGWSSSALWVDLDQDGLLDLVVLRYLDWNFDDRNCPTPDGERSYCDPKTFPPIAPLVYHNDGHGHFTEVTRKVGLGRPGKGLGIAMADYNRDGKMDLYVANDGMDEFLYRNKGDGTFEETGVSANAATDDNGRNFAGMGVVFQDLNNDGLPDIAVGVLAQQTYPLFVNRGDGSFDYASASAGFTRLTMTHSAWGMAALDSDNRGQMDLIAAQGHVNVDIKKDNPQLNYLEPPLLLRREGSIYKDVSACLGSIEAEPFAGRGLAVGDLDNDGLEDVVMSGNDGRAFVLHNASRDSAGRGPHHWSTLELVGVASNRDGIGAEVRMVTAKAAQTATVTTGGSYASSSDKRVHFGLGDEAVIKSIEIHWPSGARQSIAAPPADRFLTITEGKGITAVTCGIRPCPSTTATSTPATAGPAAH